MWHMIFTRLRAGDRSRTF